MATRVRRKVLHRDDFGLCVLWPKTEWGRVPQPGAAFMADVDGTRRRLRVVSEQCTCQGPDEPHEHHYLTLPASTGLEPGRTCIIAV
ncbi:MAG: hypothetical protein GXY85_00680 [Candidatus Brocadiaceae bacterium]|nr:hypothetical protein [Candidatus Brocadiaceae bacterium]